MKIKEILILTVLAVALLGCGKQPERRHIVVMPDVSGSIESVAEDEVFKAMDDLVGHLKRGDRITIIPILGDAQAEASGRIIRFELPVNRQAYDSDLRHFRATLRNSMDELKYTAIKHPGTKSDILGSITLAEQEFHSDPDPIEDLLFVLSDFIHETDEVNFRRDRRLNIQSGAKEFAEQIAKRDSHDLRGTRVYLGLLRSKEYAGLNRSRRAAIQAFWMSYFKSLGGRPGFASDGPGLLKRNVEK